jgi:hypothetical protein
MTVVVVFGETMIAAMIIFCARDLGEGGVATDAGSCRHFPFFAKKFTRHAIQPFAGRAGGMCVLPYDADQTGRVVVSREPSAHLLRALLGVGGARGCC